MASLVRPWKTYYIGSDGKRCAKGTPGAKKVKEQTAKFHAQGVPGQPPQKRFPLSFDKRVAEKLLAEMVSNAERGIHDLPELGSKRKKLADYLDEFRDDMTVGMASKTRGQRRLPSAEQVALNIQRVRTILEECEFATVADLGARAPSTLAKWLIQKVGLPRKKGGFSHQSAEFYRKVAKRFAWWLSFRKRLPVRADLFDDVIGFDAKGNRVHLRRSCSPAELAKLLAAARDSKEFWRGLGGVDQQHIFAFRHDVSH